MSDTQLPARQIRVFISSTFRDMQADRDVLVKKVFPRLRKLCESRAVTWTEVDLRWGITSEQQAEGQVLPYCLAEIERTRPFFIGLLGERYGWVPESIPAELLEQQRWLGEHIEHSVTELEILHGALNNPGMAERALFYFRDPAYAAAAPGGKKDDFVETGPDAERTLGKLAGLKERIRTAARGEETEVPAARRLRRSRRSGQSGAGGFHPDHRRTLPGRTKSPIPSTRKPRATRNTPARGATSTSPGPDTSSFSTGRLSLRTRPWYSPESPAAGKRRCWPTGWSATAESHPQDLVIQHYIGSTPDSADWMRVVSTDPGRTEAGIRPGR